MDKEFEPKKNGVLLYIERNSTTDGYIKNYMTLFYYKTGLSGNPIYISSPF